MEDKKYEAEFLQLVMGLQGSAWMMLGKVANPITGKVERNIEAARSAIDTLMMLKEKTRGNLSQTEEDYLSDAIQQLQMNYMDEKDKPEEEVKQKE